MTKVIPLSGNIQQIDTTPTNNSFRYLTAFGYSGFLSGIPVNNVSSSYVGYETGRLIYSIDAGSYASIEMPIGKHDNLINLWARGTSGDSIFITYF